MIEAKNSAEKDNIMFTGIIEATGEVRKIEKEGTNVHFTLVSVYTRVKNRPKFGA
jgi:riboflavin synthase alpha subunit